MHFNAMPLSTNFKNSTLLIGEKLIVLGLAFLTTVLMARIAGPLFFGQFSYITSFVSLFLPLCAMGLNNVSTQYFVKYPKYSHHYMITALALRTFGALLCILIGTLCAYFLDKHNLGYIFILLVLQSLSFLFVIEFYYLSKELVKHTLRIRLTVIVLTGITKISLLYVNSELVYLIVVQGLEVTLIGLGYVYVYYNENRHTKKQIMKPIKKLSIISFFDKGKWLLFSGIAATIYLKIDQVMLANLLDVKEVAYYAAATKLSEFWYVFPILIANAYNPKLLKIKAKGAKSYQKFLLKILSFMIASALFISLLTFTTSSYLISLIYGPNYTSSAAILNIHIFAVIFIFQRAILSKWLIAEKLYKFSMLTTVLGAVANVILNLILIPVYGGVGAAWATLFSCMIASFFSLALTKKSRILMCLMLEAMLKWPKYLIIKGDKNKHVG
jgi:PST family polysaccharide transporter